MTPGIIDRSRLRAIARGLEAADELTRDGHHTAAAIMLATASGHLVELVNDAHVLDYEQALRAGIVRDEQERRELVAGLDADERAVP